MATATSSVTAATRNARFVDHRAAALRDGLREIGFSDSGFRQSQLIRLKVLERHMQQERLDEQLRWR